MDGKMKYLWIFVFLLFMPMSWGIIQNENGTYFLLNETLADFTDSIDGTWFLADRYYLTDIDVAVAKSAGGNLTITYTCSRSGGGDTSSKITSSPFGVVYGPLPSSCNSLTTHWWNGTNTSSLSAGDSFNFYLGVWGYSTVYRRVTAIYLAGFTDAFLVINALDNYTKYGYNQTDISNFTITMTNGTEILTQIANGTDMVILGNATLNLSASLWNITFSHDDYSNITYENINLSDIINYTGYMTQTHEHINAIEYMINDTYVWYDEPSTSYYDADPDFIKVGTKNSGDYMAIWIYEFMNISSINAGDVTLALQINYSNLGGTCEWVSWGVNCDTYDYIDNLSSMTVDTFVSSGCSGYVAGTMACSSGYYEFRGNVGTASNPSQFVLPKGGMYMWSSDASGSEKQYKVYRFNNSDLDKRPHFIVNGTSNFTIEVIDGFSGEAVNNATVNISNGAWSIQDVYTGTNTKTYGFDEGIYNITVTTASGLTTHTESSYDLATESNYLQIEIASTEYAIFNLTIYDEVTETIIDENITINALGSEYSEEITISSGNWYDTSENFKAEEYWFSAQGTAGTNGSDWDFRTYYVDFIDVGTGLNTFYMYLLNDTLTAQICINVFDESGSPMDGAYVELLRHYPANNTYKVVQIAKTDDNGVANLIAVPDTVVYKYLIKTTLDGTAEFTSNPAYLSDDSCYNIHLVTSIPVGVEWFQSGTVSYTYYYDSPTTSMNYIWDDSSNLVAEGCMKTYRKGVFTTLVEESCESASTGQLSHTVDNSTEATYVSNMFVAMSSEPTYQIFVGSFSHNINYETASIIGKLGLFLMVLVIITMGFAGVWNGGVAVLLTGVTILLSQATGIVDMPLVWTVGLIIMGAIVMFLNKD